MISPPPAPRRRAVFLDRDGTIIRDTGYVSRPQDVALMPGAARGLKRLADAGYALVVCTNQSGLARGYFREADLERTNQTMIGLLAAEGVRLDGIYVCPHHPEGKVGTYRRACACRKPAPGLYRWAMDDLGIDARGSWIVGDSERDLEAGRPLGLKGVRLGPGRAGDVSEPDIERAAGRIIGDDAVRDIAASATRREPSPPRDLRRLLVLLPTWAGDTVMATPLLRALRLGLPGVEIVACGRPPYLGLLAETGFVDRGIPDGGARRYSVPRLASVLERERFDAALLLPNSFRTALAIYLAGIPRRIGYAAECRTPMLTDALTIPPDRRAYGLRPVPMIPYYLALGVRLGVASAGVLPEIPVRPATEAFARRWLADRGLLGTRFVAITPGSAYGPAKGWIPERFAAVADHLRGRGFEIVFLGGPADVRVCRDIARRMAARPAGDPADVLPLKALRPVLSHAALQIAVDSGGRHFGIAAGIPVVTVAGPIHPGYTECPYPLHRVVREQVPCWPCHLHECPFDHECMQRVTVERVIREAEALLEVANAVAARAG